MNIRIMNKSLKYFEYKIIKYDREKQLRLQMIMIIINNRQNRSGLRCSLTHSLRPSAACHVLTGGAILRLEPTTRFSYFPCLN
jgi:site-specific recombinase XerD